MTTPTTTTNNNTMEPRKSAETDRRHLLADSVAPSESASMITNSEDGDRTPRARSPARAASTAGLYRGFASEEDYLAALTEWAESKKYIEHDTRVVGFYGPKTMEYYANKPGLEMGLKKKWRARKARKEEERQQQRRQQQQSGRRHTVA